MVELVSVIIPHLNQEEHLRTCLDALAAQRDVPVEFEIIVVDNGSRRMPTAVVEGREGVRLVREAEAGPGPARNRGVREARGDVLAFIDADCRADPDWLGTIVRTFDDDATTIIGGDVQVGYADPRRPTDVEPYEAIYSFRNDEHIAKGFSGTGNLAVRSWVMEDVGPFGGIEIAEDRDWGLRAGRRGHTTRYIPSMVVHHPARENFAELQLKWARHVAHDLEQYRGRRFGLVRWLVRAVAMAASPLAEVLTILRSDRVDSPRERWLALVGLVRIRLYRSVTMVRVAIARSGRDVSRAWNRGPDDVDGS